MASPLVQRDTPGELTPEVLPARFNYVGVFLTLDCNKSCFYCINTVGKSRVRPWKGTFGLTGAQWIEGLNRLRLPDDLPVTLQGGEPSLHPEFLEIILGLRDDLHIDILTNLSFDVQQGTTGGGMSYLGPVGFQGLVILGSRNLVSTSTSVEPSSS